MMDPVVGRQYNERSTNLHDAVINAEQRNSSDPAMYGIAQPALHQLAKRQFDGQRRLEPRHAARQPEIMKWGRAALAPALEQLGRICLPSILTAG
jgi:hypothetical protein